MGGGGGIGGGGGGGGGGRRGDGGGGQGGAGGGDSTSVECLFSATPLPRLCGGMDVAIPTAMPVLPLMRRLGSRAGNTAGSFWQQGHCEDTHMREQLGIHPEG